MLEDMIRVAIQDFDTVEEMVAYVEDMYGERGINALENILEEDN